MKTYLSVVQDTRNTIYHRYIEDGERKEETIQFKPFLAIESPNKSKFKTIHGSNAEYRIFDSISDMQDWKKENEGIIEILGDVNPLYMFIAAKYPKDVLPQKKFMKIFNFDIEVLCKKGFPDADKAEWPVITISCQDMVLNHYYVFGFKEPYTPKQKNVTYIDCENEHDLLMKFTGFIQQVRPDILTGWYIDGFDVPYLVNRIGAICGPTIVGKLSPIGKIKTHTINQSFGGSRTAYTIEGVAIYDYQDLYKKFTYDSREQYTLEYISKFELGEGKLDYKNKESRSLDELYENDFETFVDYNIKDTERVFSLDNKLRYIDLAIELTYMAKCLPKDVFGTVGIWDAFLYHTLLKRKIFCPQKSENRKKPFPGGYVQDPQSGFYEHVAVYDIASSYPNSIIAYNMSPETIIDYHKVPEDLKKISDKFGDRASSSDDIGEVPELEEMLEEAGPLLEKYNLTMAPNGHFFKKDVFGFIPETVERVFNNRVEVKRKMKEAQNKLKISKSEEEKHELEDTIACLNAKQLALKVVINALYGAMSNEWFRYFDLRIASGITAAGRLSVRGAVKYLEREIPGLVNRYVDTDSLFLHLAPFVEKRFKGKQPTKRDTHDFCLKFCDKIIQPKVNEFYNKLGKALNFFKPALKMEFEVLSDASMFLEKKKYVMNIINDEGKEYLNETKLKIRGIEIVRTSTPQYIRDRLKEVVALIFTSKDEDIVRKRIHEIKTEYATLPFEEVAFPRSVGTFDKYQDVEKAVPIAVRASKLYNQKLEEYNLQDSYRTIHEGDKVKFTYIKTPNTFGSDVVGFLDSFPKEWYKYVEIDDKVMWEKAFESPMQKIFDVMGWRLSDKDVSLNDFFS